MTDPARPWWRPSPRALAIGWTLALLAGVSIPGSELPSFGLLSRDKLLHLVGFGVFALLWLRVAPGRPGRVLAAGVLFGAFTEVYQGLMPLGRFADGADFVADALGAGLGVLVGLALGRRGWLGFGAPRDAPSDAAASNSGGARGSRT